MVIPIILVIPNILIVMEKFITPYQQNLNNMREGKYQDISIENLDDFTRNMKSWNDAQKQEVSSVIFGEENESLEDKILELVIKKIDHYNFNSNYDNSLYNTQDFLVSQLEKYKNDNDKAKITNKINDAIENYRCIKR